MHHTTVAIFDEFEISKITANVMHVMLLGYLLCAEWCFVYNRGLKQDNSEIITTPAAAQIFIILQPVHAQAHICLQGCETLRHYR